MTTPHYTVVHGKFVITGFEPDGDSVRFIPDNRAMLQHLQGGRRIRFSNHDGSVQLRFEGVDAPELHYGDSAQPMGDTARDAVLKLMGFEGIVFGNPAKPSLVTGAAKDSIQGAILTQGADTYGRPISYIFLDQAIGDLHLPGDGEWVLVDERILSQSINARLAAQGMAYYLGYKSMPETHRALFHDTALAARKDKVGIWTNDATANFVPEQAAVIGSVSKQLIFPKLFRRCIDFEKAVKKGFQGNLKDWLISTEGTSNDENDHILIHVGHEGAVKVRLSDLIQQENKEVIVTVDPVDMIFIPK